MIAAQKLRLGKGQSILLSLYSLAIVCALIYLIIVILTFKHILLEQGMADFKTLLQWLKSTVIFVIPAVLIAIPFAGSLTFFIISDQHPMGISFLKSFLKITGEFPLLLFGLLITLVLRATPTAVFLIYILLAISRLTERWVSLLGEVKIFHLESAKSLGLNVFQIIYYIYWRRFYKTFLYHVIAVFFLLLGLVTPFVALGFFDENSPQLIATQLFFNLRTSPDTLSTLFLIIICFHSLRLIFDEKAKFSEVDNV